MKIFLKENDLIENKKIIKLQKYEFSIFSKKIQKPVVLSYHKFYIVSSSLINMFFHRYHYSFWKKCIELQEFCTYVISLSESFRSFSFTDHISKGNDSNHISLSIINILIYNMWQLAFYWSMTATWNDYAIILDCSENNDHLLVMPQSCLERLGGSSLILKGSLIFLDIKTKEKKKRRVKLDLILLHG